MTKLWILLLKGGLVQDDAPGIAPKAGIARHDNRREVVLDVTVFGDYLLKQSPLSHQGIVTFLSGMGGISPHP